MVDEPRRYLLAIGIEEYDEWSKLEKVPKEIARIVDLLTGPKFSMKRILEEACVDPLASKLSEQLAEWCIHPERKSTDQLVIYWSGHGEVDTGQLLLIVENTRESTNTPAISVEQLLRPLMRSASQINSILLILDVCFAGQGALDLTKHLSDWTKSRAINREPQLSVICAAQSRNTAAQDTLASSFVAAIQTCVQHAMDHELHLNLGQIFAEMNRLMPSQQQAEFVGKYRELNFLANPRYQPDPTKRADAVGLMERVRGFEAEYLIGENSAPVPFGGRQVELDRLDNWLTDQQLDSRLVITAFAGRGKSALLVRWIESLRSRGGINETGWNLVFVPVSQRFLTSAPEIHFHLLALQLARIADETLERPATDPAGFYADQSRRLLYQLASSDKKILIVLDGLDEAFDQHAFSTIFPKAFPKTMRVVVSARQQMGDDGCKGWLNRLNWPSDGDHHLALQTLTSDQITDVLIQMGAPVDIVATELELVHRLAELTEGEPLTLRFYVEDLWKKAKGGVAISRADLDQMKPGLAPYIDRYIDLWFELQELQWDQEKKSFDLSNLDRMLAILSAAKGPLPGDDLIALLCCTFPSVNCLQTSRRLLGPLRRFVIGDGQDIPYSLNHTKIGEVLKKGRCRELMPVVENGFVNWGLQHVKGLNQGEIEPKNASAYALRFLRFHFWDAKVPAATFMNMVEDGWRRAWEHIEGGPRGFSSDIQAAWKAQHRNGSLENLGSQWRCALVLSSIKSLGHSMPSELVLSAVKKGAISVRQGQHFAELMKSDESSIKTYAHLSLSNTANPALCLELFNAALERARTAQPDDRDKLLGILFSIIAAFDSRFIPLPGALIAEALTAARTFGAPRHRDRALTQLAPHLLEDQKAVVLAEALTAAAAIGNEQQRAAVLAGLAPYLPETLLAQALTAATAISDEEYRAEALTQLAPHLPEDQKGDALAEAHVAAAAIGNKQQRAAALAGLAPHLPENQKATALAEALTAAAAIGNEQQRAAALAGLAPHLPEDQKATALAEALAAAIEIEWAFASALTQLAPHLPETLLAQALATAAAIGNEQQRAAALASLAPHLPEMLLIQALAAAAAIGNEQHRAAALAQLAPHLPEDQKTDALAEALAAAAVIRVEEHRTAALAQLAQHLPEDQKTDALAEALATAAAISDEWARAEALVELAPHLPETQLNQALAAATAISDEGDRAEALAGLAPYLPETLIAEALTASAAICDEGGRASALAQLAPYLPEDQKTDALTEALAASAAISDEWARTETLAQLAPFLPDDQKTDALTKALAAATAICDDGDRAKGLAQLAPHLLEDQKAATLAETLTSVVAITDEGDRAATLAKLAQHLPEDQKTATLAEALATASAIEIEWARAAALASLASHLPETLLAQAFAVATAISDEWAQAEVLAGLAPHLPEDQKTAALAEALAVTITIGNDWARAEVLAKLVPLLPEDQKATALADALAATDAICDEGDRATALVGLALHLPESLIAEALAVVDIISDEGDRATALANLAQHLPETLHEEFLCAFFKTVPKLSRKNAFKELGKVVKIVDAVGETEDLIDIHRAITDVAIWYP